MNHLTKGINVVSLFDGISCGQEALERAEINVSKYIASEIKDIGIKVTKENWPNTIHIGDVLKVHYDAKTNSLYSNCERKLICSLGHLIHKSPIVESENKIEEQEEKEEPKNKHKHKQKHDKHLECWSLDDRKEFELKGYTILQNGDVVKGRWTDEEILFFKEMRYETAPSGEVFEWDFTNAIKVHDSNTEGYIDLLIGGSPCQDFSIAGSFSGKTQKGEYGLDGLKSRLFYEYLRIKEEIEKSRNENDTPLLFFLENVHMKEESEKNLNQYMGVNGIHLNSRLVCFQNRPRIYWTNIFEAFGNKYIEPKDLGFSFQDYKELPKHGDEAKKRIAEALLSDTPSRHIMWDDGMNKGKFSCKNITFEPKVSCLTRKQDRCPNSGLIAIEADSVKEFWKDNKKRMDCRFITKREVELAQTLRPDYLKSLSYLQAQDVAGDGWTVDAIAYFFKGLPQEYKEFFKLPQGKTKWDLNNFKVN